jgi:hypothetical protein
MTMLTYPVRISANGEVTPIPDWTGGETEARIHVKLTETVEARKPARRSKIMERTPEERQAAFDDFMKAWEGCLKGVPHMTAKEIRAERLEKKYGQLDKDGSE